MVDQVQQAGGDRREDTLNRATEVWPHGLGKKVGVSLPRLLQFLAIALSTGGVLVGCLSAGVPVTALAFSPDGQMLASAGQRRIALHDMAGTNRSLEISTDLTKITGLAFAPTRKLIAVSGGEPGVAGAALLLDGGTSRELIRLPNDHDLANSVAFDHTGSILGVAAAEQVRIYRITAKTADVKFELTGHSGAVLAVAFSPDDSLVVTAGRDCSVKVWSAADGRLLRSFNHHTEAAHAVTFRRVSDGIPITCATGSDDRTVRVWHPDIGRMVRIVRRHEGAILALAYSSDGRWLLSAGSEGLIRRIDADSDEIVSQWRASDDWIYCLAVSPDGHAIATGDWSGQVNLWNASGVLLRRWTPRSME